MNFSDFVPTLDNVILFSIRYDQFSDNWEKRLKAYILQIIAYKAENNNAYDYDVAIVCALRNPELDEILALPFSWEANYDIGDYSDYYTGIYQEKKIICSYSYEMGMPAASILSTRIIDKFKPRYLIMTGIAAGADRSKISYGDVMIADPCFNYDSGKQELINGESVFRPDYRQTRLSPKLQKIVNRISTYGDALTKIKKECPYPVPETPLKIHIGPFASGAAVLSDIRAVNGIREHNRKLLGFDMEAYAVMLAGTLSSMPQTTAIVMKAVSDFGDDQKNDNYQQYASYTSARVLQLLLDELLKQ